MQDLELLELVLVTAATLVAASAVVFAVCFVSVSRQRRRACAELDAAQAVYEGQQAAIWQEGYSAGAEDERIAAGHNAGTSEKVTPNRVNPYEAKAVAR